MPRSSGTYSAPAGQPVVNGDIIDATVHNNLITDIGNEITNSIPRDGTAPPTANLPLGGYKITGLANGTAATDAAAFGQIATAITANNVNYLPLAGGSLTGAIETKRATVAATVTTTPLWTTANGNVQDWTSTPTITALPNAPQAGSQRIVYPAAGTIITNNANIIVQGNANYTVQSGDELTITAITTSTFYVTIQKADGTSLISSGKQIQPITAIVATNALTVTLNPTTLDFRDSTLTSGTVNTRTVSSAISCVVPSTATLGTVNAVQSRIVVLAIDNAGTVELAVVNIAGGNDLSETGVISTTALSATADSSNVIYSTTARTNVPYRVVGYVESTQATAGAWVTPPSTIQGFGGNAFAAMNSLGFGQTFQNVTGSRVSGTTYYNTTGKPIQVLCYGTTGAAGAGALSASVNGAVINMTTIYGSGPGYAPSVSFIVPVSVSYSITYSGSGGGSITNWSELR